MKNLRSASLLFALSFPIAANVAAQEAASTGEEKVTELQELVVKGENVWFEGNKVVFKLLKSTKNLSTDAASLIDNMNTGLLKVKDGEITTTLGEPVAIFINGVRADNIDLSTFWPKNALRVEYMESSDDPRFQGATNIVNFVMKEYVSGGVTKLNAYQTVPNSGSYSASSKLVYKNMTYNALLKGGYSRDHRSGSDETQHYDGVWYDGDYYNRIEREERIDEVSRENEMYAGINARYLIPNKLRIVHSAALQWKENPESGSHGFTQYSPTIINTDYMRSASNSRSLSPSLTGAYGFTLKRDLGIVGSWHFNHSHNNNFSSFIENEVGPIENRAVENLFNYGVNFKLHWGVRDNSIFVVNLSENRNLSTIDYSGSANSRQWQQFGTTDLSIRWWWQPLSKLTFNFTPQLSIADRNINHTSKRTEWLPGINASLRWNVGRRTTIGLTGSYYQHSPASSVLSDLIIRQSELKWLEGNPLIDTQKTWSVWPSFYSAPTSWLNTQAYFSYNSYQGESILLYRSGGPQYDGVIGQYLNAGTGHDIGFHWEGNATLFNNRLNLGEEIEYNYRWYDYAGSRKAANWRNRLYIAYNLGNCQLSLVWYTPTKRLMNGGTTVTKTDDTHYLNFSYGNGNFYFYIQGANLFSKYKETDIAYRSGAFSYNGTSRTTGRSLFVTLTYTFDYGKKVDPDVNIDIENVKSSAILGSD